MTGWLPDEVTDLFGADATAEESYDLLTVDVPADTWTTSLRTARTTLGCTYFDWLSAVDEPGTGFRVCAHVVALHPVRRLLVRTTVPHTTPVLASAVDVYAGAAWHERETHEMFGIDFTGHPGLDPLLLPDTFEGHPLRKDFVLAARVAKAWPGAKEPGESTAGAGHGGPKRRQMLPPGVPDPNEWGPLKGQLPPAPSRPARGARAGAAGGARSGAGAGAGAAGERPVRRTRTASQGSASQAIPAAGEADATRPEAGAAPTRRTRSASQGSASQGPARSDEGGSATPDPGQADAAPSNEADAATPARSTDAPWHHARPAFTEPAASAPEPAASAPEPAASAPEAESAPKPKPKPTAPGDTPDESTPDEDTPDEEPPAGGDPA